MKEKSTLQQVKDFLKTFMLVEAGGFIGRSLQIYTRYRKQSGYYALTDPWYIDVLESGVITAIIIIVTALIYGLVCYKTKKGE